MSTDYNNLAQLLGNKEGTTYIFSRLPWEKVRFFGNQFLLIRLSLLISSLLL